MKTFYRFKFYLNARHSVTLEGKTSNIHPHTWEVVILFGAETSDTINFSRFERSLTEYFQNYEGKYLNELKAFSGINPSMENIGKVLYTDIKELMSGGSLNFKRLEISENPTRTYILENE